ncbi:MAG: hypothetical protein Q8Q52_04030, partial [Acidimicrobiia bacterium]|nr:hypothetical protein [Acidimicrobiia bacterium]
DDRIVGEMLNEWDVSVSGPIEVSVLCFSESDKILAYYSDFTDQDDVGPQALLPFAVGVSDPCPKYLIAAAGFES